MPRSAAAPVVNCGCGCGLRLLLEPGQVPRSAAPNVDFDCGCGQVPRSSTAAADPVVVDSGCTWHVHPHQSDLVNQRATNESIAGIDGEASFCSCIGDLPMSTFDSSRVAHVVTSPP